MSVEDDLQTFEGWLGIQGHDPDMLTPDDLAMWRGQFDDAMQRRASSPKVGLMKLRAPGQKYGVALRDESGLWLTLWIRCAPKGDVYILYPRGEQKWDPHASYHHDGTFHQKSHGRKAPLPEDKRQPLTAAFSESEHLGTYAGHGKGSGAVCEPKDFDGLVIVEPGILGPIHGRIGVDLVAPGYEETWERDVADRFYRLNESWYSTETVQRKVFSRGNQPSVIITVQRTASG